MPSSTSHIRTGPGPGSARRRRPGMNRTSTSCREYGRSVKIEVRGDRARLYVHGHEQPTLIVNDVKSGAERTRARSRCGSDREPSLTSGT